MGKCDAGDVACFCSPMTLAADAETNPYGGRQERAEAFAFAQKPAVSKKGPGYVITFASKAPCDATVAIVDKHFGRGVRMIRRKWSARSRRRRLHF